MNTHTREVILLFLSEKNFHFLYNSLAKYYANQPYGDLALSYLQGNLMQSSRNFADEITREMQTSDAAAGITIHKQLTCYNNQFLQDRVAFIDVHVCRKDLRPPQYYVDDMLPTSHYDMSRRKPNQILDSWASNVSRGIQVREDRTSECGPTPSYVHASAVTAGRPAQTGISFCDQSDIGTANHLDMYENTMYKQVLNRVDRPWENSPFGVSNFATDSRLMERRIFRSNEAGVENGIPRYEQRLYKRNIERDINEGLRSAELGTQIRGYNMDSLYSRVDAKQKERRRYDLGYPQCVPGPQYALSNNSVSHFSSR